MSQNLYEQLAFYARINERPAIPDYLRDGLNPALELRPYQVVALGDFMNYFAVTAPEGEPLFRQAPAQTLLHMATGSGKTLIMAGIMLYLYEQGYRNFLFFVNSTNVLAKTRDNFLHPGSPKYLFNSVIRVNDEPVVLREVKNFAVAQNDGINICFSTIQGLHADLTIPGENRMTYEDFEASRVVLISDEAHHINTLTKQGLKRSEIEYERSWENTVARIAEAHPENVLLEFTATIDLANPAIAAKYDDKIVADYPLARYRGDGYSKEIRLLQADFPPLVRALQAVVLSQYRLKLFERRGLAIKPVVMFKSRSIKENGVFFAAFGALMASLDEKILGRLAATTTSAVAGRAFAAFADWGISLDLLAMELRESFAPLHCLAIDSEKISPERQLAVNSLESKGNPYRAVFAVDMLNEGWDVLNLFDIVRLYDTRDAKKGKPGRSTVAEAQLIGRGARYCPFTLAEQDDAYRRKFDEDLKNELRVCEELYFHSATNSRYIDELQTALRETGMLPAQATEVEYKLKPDFAASDLYQRGWVFVNERRARDRAGITELPAAIRSRQLALQAGSSGATRTGEAFSRVSEDVAIKLNRQTRLLAELPPAVLSTALRRNERLRFDHLRAILPNLPSMAEFASSDRYIGGISLTVETRTEHPSNEQWLSAAEAVLRMVATDLRALSLEQFGTHEFRAKPLRSVITDRTTYVAEPSGDGVGVPQSRVSEHLRLNLPELPWFGYEENYGTTEEKRFLVYFSQVAERLRADHDLVVLLRNEKQLSIYDFDSGAAFQPDFLLFLHQPKDAGYRQLQVFVEPKGAYLASKDRWKEDLLLRLKDEAVAVEAIADDNEYLVWGLPFFTHEPPQELRRFTDAFDELTPSSSAGSLTTH